jgi:hypothetical protein
VNPKHKLLNHFLAALAYRTQKALRGAPGDFGSFRAIDGVRTPAELVQHMTSVLGYAAGVGAQAPHFRGCRWADPPAGPAAQPPTGHAAGHKDRLQGKCRTAAQGQAPGRYCTGFPGGAWCDRCV